jgi:small GTP-binding protein
MINPDLYMSDHDSIHSFDYLFKIIVVGDADTGKTSLTYSFSDKMFSNQYRPTIGVDFKVGLVHHQDTTIKLQIWDTAGQERFRTIISAYYRGVDGVLLCFNRHNRESFEKLEQWIDDATRFNSKNAKFLVVSCKNDLTPDVTEEEIVTFCEKHHMSWVECSSVTGHGVNEAFTEIGILCLHGAKKQHWDKLTLELEEPQSIKQRRIYNCLNNFKCQLT